MLSNYTFISRSYVKIGFQFSGHGLFSRDKITIIDDAYFLGSSFAFSCINKTALLKSFSAGICIRDCLLYVESLQSKFAASDPLLFWSYND